MTYIQLILIYTRIYLFFWYIAIFYITLHRIFKAMVCPIGQLRGNQVKVLNSPAAVSLYLSRDAIYCVSINKIILNYNTKTTELRRESSSPL